MYLSQGRWLMLPSSPLCICHSKFNTGTWRARRESSSPRECTRQPWQWDMRGKHAKWSCSALGSPSQDLPGLQPHAGLLWDDPPVGLSANRPYALNVALILHPGLASGAVRHRGPILAPLLRGGIRRADEAWPPGVSFCPGRTAAWGQEQAEASWEPLSP